MKTRQLLQLLLAVFVCALLAFGVNAPSADAAGKGKGKGTDKSQEKSYGKEKKDKDATEQAETAEGNEQTSDKGKVKEKNIDPLLNDVVEAADKSPVVSDVEFLEHRFVKNVGIKQQHAVIDVLVK